jgi:hypothetical protein
MKAIARSMAGIDAILAKQPDNIQAWQARTALIREANASSNQHSNTVNTNNKTLSINVVKRSSAQE